MLFYLSDDERRGYCEAAAAKIGLDAPSVEMDFWVFWTLREVFALPQTVNGRLVDFRPGASEMKPTIVQRDVAPLLSPEFRTHAPPLPSRAGIRRRPGIDSHPALAKQRNYATLKECKAFTNQSRAIRRPTAPP